MRWEGTGWDAIPCDGTGWDEMDVTSIERRILMHFGFFWKVVKHWKKRRVWVGRKTKQTTHAVNYDLRSQACTQQNNTSIYLRYDAWWSKTINDRLDKTIGFWMRWDEMEVTGEMRQQRNGLGCRDTQPHTKTNNRFLLSSSGETKNYESNCSIRKWSVINYNELFCLICNVCYMHVRTYTFVLMAVLRHCHLHLLLLRHIKWQQLGCLQLLQHNQQ